MAARKRKYQTEKTREKIKTTTLVNLLQAYITGKIDPKTGKPVELSTGRVSAIKILLGKTLPDLSESDITQHTETKTEEEAYNELVGLLGDEGAKKIYEQIKATKH